MTTLIEKLLNRVGKRETSVQAPEETARPEHRILFVCMGNICRSPTAEGVLRHLVAAEAPELSVFADSAGTHAYHIGEPPDPRARRAAERRGIDLSGLRARRVVPEDFARFDLVLAMDDFNVALLQDQCPAEHRERIQLFLDYAPDLGRRDVPDPYYGGSNGFEYVLDLVEAASRSLIVHLRTRAPRRR